MNCFQRMGFTKDEGDQMMARYGVNATSIAKLIRYFEASVLISRFRRGSPNEDSVRLRRPC